MPENTSWSFPNNCFHWNTKAICC